MSLNKLSNDTFATKKEFLSLNVKEVKAESYEGYVSSNSSFARLSRQAVENVTPIPTGPSFYTLTKDFIQVTPDWFESGPAITRPTNSILCQCNFTVHLSVSGTNPGTIIIELNINGAALGGNNGQVSWSYTQATDQNENKTFSFSKSLYLSKDDEIALFMYSDTSALLTTNMTWDLDINQIRWDPDATS